MPGDATGYHQFRGAMAPRRVANARPTAKFGKDQTKNAGRTVAGKGLSTGPSAKAQRNT